MTKMSKARLLAIATLTVVATTAIVVVRSRLRVRVWDLSASRSPDLVPWPVGKAPWDEFADFDINGRVIVHFPHGKTFDSRVRAVTFSRHGQQILSVTFNSQDQTASGAYATALELAKQWNLPRAPIDQWWQLARSGKVEYASDIRNDAPQTVGLEIFDSFRKDKPFRVMLQIGWRDE